MARASSRGLLESRARIRVQISAMIAPGIVVLSRRMTWVIGRVPVASSADRASSFWLNFAQQARSISFQ